MKAFQIHAEQHNKVQRVQQRLTCPIETCGITFSLKRNMTRHYFKTHSIVTPSTSVTPNIDHVFEAMLNNNVHCSNCSFICIFDAQFFNKHICT